MAWTRPGADRGAYLKDVYESVAPAQYILDPVKVVRCDACRPAAPPFIGSVGVSLPRNISLADVDSELIGLNYPLSRDPRTQYHPSHRPGTRPMSQTPVDHLPACGIQTISSRLVLPPCTLRGTGINRFIPLQRNPQARCRWERPSDTHLDIRNITKDAYRPRLPRPMRATDRFEALPLRSAKPMPEFVQRCSAE